MVRYLIFVACVFLSQVSFACAGGFWRGHDLSLVELIDQTDTIILATFNESGEGKIGFSIGEVIKADRGSVEESLEYFTSQVRRAHFRYKDSHNSTDFSGHASELFWKNENSLQDELVTRVGWSPGACGPLYTFKNDEQYLLFLESPGSLYAAEIIKSKGDLWYKYVIEHTKKP